MDDDQTGYIKDRYIGCNIRLVEDIIHYTSLTKTPGILLSVDFEKAFDSIRWDYILSSMKAFNFGPNFISYIKTLYNGISTAIINNGYISTWFQPERGVRQGCPISPYLFILAVETLANKIREDKTIKGILLNGTEIKSANLLMILLASSVTNSLWNIYYPYLPGLTVVPVCQSMLRRR